jgi:hypothetical protein
MLDDPSGANQPSVRMNGTVEASTRLVKTLHREAPKLSRIDDECPIREIDQMISELLQFEARLVSYTRLGESYVSAAYSAW